MTTPHELLPCPFCGCDAKFVHNQNTDGVWVECMDPNCWAEIRCMDTKKEAAERWNKRASVQTNEPIKLGVIEFHTTKNKALIDDFYRVVTDLRDAGCIVDLWLMDIAATLDKHGYEMKVWRKDEP